MSKIYGIPMTTPFNPEKLRGGANAPYELIETITLEEDVTSVVRTQEPPERGGTPYNFEQVVLRTTFPACSFSGNTSIFYNIKNYTKSIRAYFLLPYSTTATKRGYNRIWCENGKYRNGWWTCVSNEGEMATYYENPLVQGKYSKEDGNISKIEITNGSGIPAGTVIEIWGVRADA